MSSWRGRDPRLAKDKKNKDTKPYYVCVNFYVPTSTGESSGVPHTMRYPT